MARGKFGFSTERMRRIFRENWSFFFRYQRSIHKEFLFADRFDGEPECKYYESDRSCRGYWRYDLQKQGMELRALRNPEHEYIRILGVSACIAVSVYQDELFFKVKKKSSDYLFFNFDSFGFSLFAFRFSTKALGKNINFVCFFNSEREWLVFPENSPHTLSSVFYGDFIFTLVTIFLQLQFTSFKDTWPCSFKNN